eukprot:521401_1
MRSISCNENYSLFQKGDRAKEIYIQRRGESIINYYDGTSKILKRGDVIGERSMVSPKRKFSVQCSTFSEFYVLSVQDIVSILQTEYPTTWTKRWRNMIKQLKSSINKNKKYIRTVNLNENYIPQPPTNIMATIKTGVNTIKSAVGDLNTSENISPSKPLIQKSSSNNAFADSNIDRNKKNPKLFVRQPSYRPVKLQSTASLTKIKRTRGFSDNEKDVSSSDSSDDSGDVVPHDYSTNSNNYTDNEKSSKERKDGKFGGKKRRATITFETKLMRAKEEENDGIIIGIGDIETEIVYDDKKIEENENTNENDDKKEQKMIIKHDDADKKLDGFTITEDYDNSNDNEDNLLPNTSIHHIDSTKL